jgi:hypothetical protein
MPIVAKAIQREAGTPADEAEGLQTALNNASPPHCHLVALVSSGDDRYVLAVFEGGEPGSAAFENLSPG